MVSGLRQAWSVRSRTDGMWWGTAIEAPDPGALAKFYSELLGWPGYLAAVWPPVDGAGLEGLFAV